VSIQYNGTTIEGLSYNSIDVEAAFYESTQVYARTSSVLILASTTLQTETSVVPPPYDENGYNYNASAPKKTATLSVPLGDITSYNSITFRWDNEGSGNAYGDISGTVKVGEITKNLFSGLNASGEVTLDVSSLSGEYALRFDVEAQSRSSYKLYRSTAVLNLYNICGVTGSAPTPVPTGDSFSLNTGISVVPGPYDADGYNYSGSAPAKTDSHTLTVDVTDKNTLTFAWSSNISDDDEEKSRNDYGNISAKYVDPYGSEQYLYNKSQNQKTDDITHYESIDVSAFSGNISLEFTVYAKSASSYRGYSSRAVLYVTNIALA
jgi:hypothetical protein